MRRGESGCGEGADEADTKVSFDNELDDLRTKGPSSPSPREGVTGGVTPDARA